ncbi:MAG: DUF58 domain-containing protein [Gemmatales bacterium]|nr:DUF58 domain-containing protein [Gemmatales bacterium]MDW7995198.1 DUF58 domain-containing protein [Gemmatales bacterium]
MRHRGRFQLILDKVRQWAYRPWVILALSAAIAAVLGWTVFDRLLIFSALLAIVLVLGIAWPRITLLGLTGACQFSSQRTTEGESALLQVRLTNWFPWPAFDLQLQLGSGDARADSLRISRVAPWSQSEHHWEYRPKRRGVHPLARVEVCTAFPFGLWHARKAVVVSFPLLVWPKTFPVAPPPWEYQRESWMGQRNPHLAGYGGDFLGLRPFRPGDTIRRVHWPQSLRLQQLVVCEQEAESRMPILLVLDTSGFSEQDSALQSAGEWAVRATASLARGWLEMGYTVGLVCSSGLTPPRGGTHQLHLLMDTLAQVPLGSDTTLAQLLYEARPWILDGSLVVVITSESALLATPIGYEHNVHYIVFPVEGQNRNRRPTGRASGCCLFLDTPEDCVRYLAVGWEKTCHG